MGNSNVKQFGLKLADKSFFFFSMEALELILYKKIMKF